MKKIFLYILLTGLFVSCNKSKDIEVVEPEEQLEDGIIKFSGYKWIVKRPKGTQGPHNNFWSEENVWVDDQGHLHLRVRLNPATKRWECAEVQSTIKFGNGTYQWKLEGPVNSLDKNLVLGLFNYSGNSTFDEMDIEFSRWGYAHAPILNYSIWPATGDNVPYTTWSTNFTMTSSFTTHRWHRTNASLHFESLNGFQDGSDGLFVEKKWTSPPTSISKIEMPVFMNFWLFKTVPPSDGKDIEIVIHEFKFTPL